MFGFENKSKILKNKNGHTSIRTSSNIDLSFTPPAANNQKSKNNKDYSDSL